MPFDRRNHHRQSIRLRDYDYTLPNLYFVTLCTYARHPLFDEPHARHIAKQHWESMPYRFDYITLDAWIVMPDHLHAIVAIQHSAPQDETISPRAARSLASLVAGFKSAVTSRINTVREQRTQVWQRNYWEHIIRDERDLNNTRRYILENPQRWTIRNMNQP